MTCGTTEHLGYTLHPAAGNGVCWVQSDGCHRWAQTVPEAEAQVDAWIASHQPLPLAGDPAEDALFGYRAAQEPAVWDDEDL